MNSDERRRVRQFRTEGDERRKVREPVRIAVLLRPVRPSPPSATSGPAPPRTLAARNATGARMLAEVFGPCDEAALRAAVSLRAHAAGHAQIVAFTASGTRDDAGMAEALARGADRAVAVVDPALDAVDYHGVARALAAAVERAGYDLVLAGQSSLDEAQGVTGPAVAELLGICHLSDVRQLAVDQGQVRVERRDLKIVRTLRLRLPALLTLALPDADEVEAEALPTAGPPPPARPRPGGPGSVEQLDLETLGLSAQELRYRGQFLGRTFPVRVARNVTVLDSAAELVSRLESERLLPR